MEKINNKNYDDVLWNESLNLHNVAYNKQVQYLLKLKDIKNIISNKLFFRTLTNMLHVFYMHTNNEFTNLYIDLLLSIKLDSANNLNAGDVFEILGIVIKGCNSSQKKNIIKYIDSYIYLCKQDVSAIISVCNCFRYMYPEMSLEGKEYILNTLDKIKEDNLFSSVVSSLEFTIKTLKEV